MQKYVVIADDLTGSNATCSLLKKIGLRSASIFRLDSEEEYGTEVISYSTNSRSLPQEKAYDRVAQAMQKLKKKDVLVYNKRIDSTLRGNIGVEIDAMLNQLEQDRIAIVVPAYPSSGRIVINKIMLVNGVLLENSDAGRDPKTPIHTSCVEEIIKEQTKYPCFYFNVSDIAKEEEEFVKRIKEVSKKAKLLLFDAVTNEDIVKISKAVISSELNIITVDPGPFTLYYTRELQKKKHLDKKILMVIGSVTDTTKKQIEYILQQEDIFLEKMNPSLLFHQETREQEMNRVVSMVKKGINSYDLFLITTSPIGQETKLNLVDLAIQLNTTVEEVSKSISDTLTEGAYRILKETQKFDGVYSSGGDITLALLEKLNANGVEIREEVIPLAAYGRILGGEFANLKLVSKGGMVGDQETITLCLSQMKKDI